MEQGELLTASKATAAPLELVTFHQFRLLKVPGELGRFGCFEPGCAPQERSQKILNALHDRQFGGDAVTAGDVRVHGTEVKTHGRISGRAIVQPLGQAVGIEESRLNEVLGRVDSRPLRTQLLREIAENITALYVCKDGFKEYIELRPPSDEPQNDGGVMDVLHTTVFLQCILGSILNVGSTYLNPPHGHAAITVNVPTEKYPLATWPSAVELVAEGDQLMVYFRKKK